jgi:KDO2-lipid IV(A) lauroyltransferase
VRALRHWLEYVVVRAVLALVGALPHRLVLALGTAIGLTFYALDRPHRRLAVENLQAAFPLRSRADCRRIARGTFGHFGRLLTALLKFSTMSRARMRALVEFEGTERVDHARAAGRGVLFFTGHFGFWELHAIAHPLTGPPIAVLARALDNPRLNALLERVRTCTGNAVIHRRGALRRVLRLLESNQGVALLIDQHVQTGDAVIVDFFNRPAATTTALAALALRTGARVIPVFALPVRGRRYRMIYEHAVEPPAPSGVEAPAPSVVEAPAPGAVEAAGGGTEEQDAVREFTQRCTDVLEMYVRRYPELWLWMHRRWRDLEPVAASVPGMFPAAAADPADPADPADHPDHADDADERR